MIGESMQRRGGFVLLVVSSILILAIGFSDAIPAVVGGVAVLAMAAGTLLVGTSGMDQPV